MAVDFRNVAISSKLHSVMKKVANAEGKFIWKAYDDLLLSAAERRLAELNSNKGKNHHGRGNDKGTKAGSAITSGR